MRRPCWFILALERSMKFSPRFGPFRRGYREASFLLIFHIAWLIFRILPVGLNALPEFGYHCFQVPYCRPNGSYEFHFRSFKDLAARGAATAFISGRAKSSNSRAL